jgi:hypothetical protein
MKKTLLSLSLMLTLVSTVALADKCYKIDYNPITGKAKVTPIPCP